MAGKAKRGRSSVAQAQSPAPSVGKSAAAAAKRTQKKRLKAAVEEEPDTVIDNEVLDQSSDEAPEDTGSESEESGSEQEADGNEEREVDFSKLVGVGDSDGSDDEGAMETMALADLPSQVMTDVRNDEPALEKKLIDISIFSKAQDRKAKKLPFWESLSVTMPLDEKLADEMALDDLKREQKFAEMATAAAHLGLEKLRKDKVKFRRPSDYFAEMIKTDSQMAKVKARILHQKETIESAEKRRHNREVTKNRKKVRSEQLEKEQGKKKKAKEEIETFSRLRKQRIKERAEGGQNMSDDDDEFPIDLLEVEQLDSQNKFQSQKEIASGKRKAWSEVDKNEGKGSGKRDGRKNPKRGSVSKGTRWEAEGVGKKQRRQGGRGDEKLGAAGGIKKSKGPKKRLGRSRRKASGK